MKAIQLVKYGPAKTAFKTAEVPTPKLNNKEDILIKVHAFGLNFADIMARKGLYRAAPDLPAILGYEVVGEVVKVNCFALLWVLLTHISILKVDHMVAIVVLLAAHSIGEQNFFFVLEFTD